uniref:Aminotransferase-like plant mobile domain-containing protein n=1 Tax=Solanum lycopersicum TaxID=4081 RepID=A0A3Q7G2K2_SOLLC
MESFVRFLRVSKLAGLECQDPYQPNRVAMQFGYDQDFPKLIPHLPSSPELAWYNYSIPIASDLRYTIRLGCLNRM